MSNFIPVDSGFAAGLAPSNYQTSPGAECRGAYQAVRSNGQYTIVAGTATKLFQITTVSATDVSRVGDYSLASGDRWSFTQFGDTTLAATITAPIQSSNGSADFADIAGAPNATIVESVESSGGGFVLAFNTDDGEDYWHCCAVNDVTDWTPSVARQCAKGRLVGSEGPIRAARKFGEDKIIAYKDKAMYVGTYVGGDVVWQWNEITEWGCYGPDAVANLGAAHVVFGSNDVYIYDGVRPFSIAHGVRRTMYQRTDTGNLDNTILLYEKSENRIWLFVRYNFSSIGPDMCYVYHLGTKKWGVKNGYTTTREVEAAFVMRFNNAYQIVSFNSSHQPQLFAGSPGSSFFSTGLIGDDTTRSQVLEVKLRYGTDTLGLGYSPSSASVSATNFTNTGDTNGTAGPSVSASDVPSGAKNRFTPRQTGKFHAFTFSFTGSVVVDGYDVKLKPVGNR